MRIGELSKRAGVSRDTIRFYERSGLISSRPGGSKTNNYREYPEQTMLTLDLIRQAKSAGFTLEELVQFLRRFEQNDCDDYDGEAFLEHKIKEVRAKIDRSTRFLETLQTTLDALRAAIPQSHFPKNSN